MTTLHDAYINALLADATYALDENTLNGQTGVSLTNILEDRMTSTLANFIGDNFTVATHIESGDIIGSGFDATVWRGKAGEYAGKTYISMQGTTGFSDWTTDIDLSLSGAANRQIEDMVNWWLKNTTAVGSQAQQILWNGYSFENNGTVAGTGIITERSNIVVDGHSLGGHLATAFTRLFGGQAGWSIDHTYTYNSAGFTGGSEGIFQQIEALLGAGVSRGFFNGVVSQTNFFAENGINLTTNTLYNNQVGLRTPVFNEETTLPINNHYMYKLTDALALGDAIAKLDTTFTISKMNDLFDKGSNKTEESLEKILDGLRQTILGGEITDTPIGDVDKSAPSRATFYENLKFLTDSTTFQALIGKVTVVTPPASASEARSDLGLFLSLYYLTPFALKTDGSIAADAQLTIANPDLATQFKDDKLLTLEKIANGEANFSDQYLKDRADMLNWQNKLNAEDFVDNTGLGYVTSSSQGLHFEDKTSGKIIDINKVLTNKQNYIFGTNTGDAALTGGDNSDHLYGMGGADTLSGGMGSDWLEGGADADTLNGNEDNDSIYGGAGDDTITGGTGNDFLYGGAGIDTYIYTAGDGNDVITDTDGLGKVMIGTTQLTGGKQVGSNNTFQSADKQHTYTYLTGNSVDGGDLLIDGKILIKNHKVGGAGNLGLTFTGATNDLPTVPATTREILGDMKYKILQANLPWPQVPTSEYGMTILSWSADGVAYSPPVTGPSGGNGSIVSYDYIVYDDIGNVVTEGSDPGRNDGLQGSEGNDHILTGSGDDAVNAKGGDDYIEAGSGNDVVSGDNGNDYIDGGTGNDFLTGNEGNDSIIGGEGTDVLLGDNGDDILYSNTILSIEAAIANGNSQIGTGQRGNWLAGGAGEDTLIGDSGNDVLFGGLGADTLIGGAGDDDITGDDNWVPNVFAPYGFEWTVTGTGNVEERIFSPLLNNSIATSGGNDLIYAGAGNDHVWGDYGNDILFGEGGNDVLVGGDGDDVLVGGDGDDVLIGDSRFTSPSHHGNDTIYGGDGNDQILGNSGDDVLNGGNGNDKVWGDEGNDSLDGGSGNDELIGGTGDDVLNGGENDDQLWGEDGNDYLNGGLGSDVLDGGAGNDTLVGSGEGDILIGGAGIDVFYAGAGDLIIDQEDNEDLNVLGNVTASTVGVSLNSLLGPAAVSIDLGAGALLDIQNGTVALGNATYVFADGSSIKHSDLLGNNLNSVVNLQSAAPMIFGGKLNDTLTAIGLIDTTLYGGLGSDYLLGNIGNDKLYGGAGNDILDGGAGIDVMQGGEGNDTYVLDNVADVVIENANEGIDTIKIGFGVAGGSYALANNIENVTLTNSVTFTLTGNNFDNILTGNSAANIFRGGAGNDLIFGNAGDDTYIFSKGDGSDVIYDFDTLLSTEQWSQDVLQFTDIRSTDITGMFNSGGDLVMQFGTDQILIKGQLTAVSDGINKYLTHNGIDRFIFSDGVSWIPEAALRGYAPGIQLTGTQNNDTLVGGYWSDVINGGAGNDTIYNESITYPDKNASPDTIQGGLGNDTMTGGGARTTYIFSKGDGVDRVIDGITLSFGESALIYGNPDKVKFTDVNSSELIVTKGIGENYTLGYGVSDAITISSGIYVNVATSKTTYSGVEFFEFANGQKLDEVSIKELATANIITGSSVNDTLTGWDGRDQIQGGQGNDTLNGADGSDTYIFSIGDGQDLITDYIQDRTYYPTHNSNNQIQFTNVLSSQISIVKQANNVVINYGASDSITLFYQLYNSQSNYDKIKSIKFSDNQIWSRTYFESLASNSIIGTVGNDVINETGLDDVITGGQGNDTIFGGTGRDVYRFATGDGQDVIYSNNSSAPDVLFLNGISSASVQLSRVGLSLIVSLSSADKVTLMDYFSHPIDRIAFDDGTEWNYTYIQQQVSIPTTGDDNIEGSIDNDVINALAGNDYIFAYDGNDTLIGGSGNDTLDGGASSDKYVFTAGDGHDVINDAIEYNSNDRDIIEINGVLPANVVLQANQKDLVLIYGSDSITISGWYVQNNHTIEQINFINSGVVTVWDKATINALAPIVPIDLTIFGTTGDDLLTGANGNDTLDGGAGNDTLIGGTGNDHYYFSIGGGIDTIDNSATDNATATDTLHIQGVLAGALVLNRSVDDLRIKVSATDNITIKNYYAAGADNKIDQIQFDDSTIWNQSAIESQVDIPTTGNDLLTGTTGNDTIHALSGNDTVFGGAGDDQLFGDAGNDILNGDTGDDSLDGGAGIDTMIGGLGNDTYTIDVLTDVITENLNEGTDLVKVAVATAGGTYTVTANVENATLTNTVAYSLTGNALDNVLTGNAAANTLNGGAGNDTLNGLAGNDTMIGGLGNDTYTIDVLTDVITENLNEGTDLVNVAVATAGGTYTVAANVENATLTNTVAYSLTGNALDNVLIGNTAANTLTGGDGNDMLEGDLGIDTLIGGLGNDSYNYYIGDGNDQIDNTATDNATAIDTLYLKDTLPASVVLSRVVNDLLVTISASDSIRVKNYFAAGDSKIDQIIFSDATVWNQTDIQSHVPSVPTTGDDNLTGTAGNDTIDALAGNDTVAGGDGNDQLLGNTGNDSLDGGNGNDTLDGGAGNDTMVGGLGNDTYTIDALTDVITENLNEGTDLVNVAIATASGTYTVAANVENATLTNTVAYSLIGNALDNVLTGNAAVNTLNGGAGNDTMIGGLGNDIYVVDSVGDVVTETSTLATELDTVQSSVSYTLGANVENLTLTGTAAINATGNTLANNLTGNAGNNILDGGAGVDTLVGGAGNDTYLVDLTATNTLQDTVTEVASGGTDTVILRGGVVAAVSTITLGTEIDNLDASATGTTLLNFTGNTLANIITGNAANNVINGLAGNDTMIGGAGNDTYTIDVLTDVITENLNEGTDLVNVAVATAGGTYTLAANVENATLTNTVAYTLTGNALDNVLTGNAAANTLNGGAGNDTLNGLAGNDTMIGGLGNDTYTIDVLTDVITENLNEGIDLVNVAVATASGTYTLAANVENATLTNTVAYSLTGNALDNILTGNAAANTLNGGDGNDTLNGLAGNDTMVGGLGNDIYTIDVTTDVVTEAASAGTDTVNVTIATASGTYTIATNVENAILTNTVAYNLTGNALANFLMGNAANNTLTDTAGGNDLLQGLAGTDTLNDTVGNNLFDGGLGNDTITGGTGREIFIGGLGNDTITTGTGFDVISFNKGDGQDIINASTGADNTISLGGNFAYSDLSLTKTANDLILKMGATDQITLKDWYLSSPTNKSVINLQVVAEAIQGFTLGGADALRNNKIENFNFTNLVAAFDAAGATANWQLTDAILTTHLQAGSDAAAIGGDLAYQYGKNSNLTGMGSLNAQSVIAAASFGQTAQTLNNPTVWQAELVKLG